MVIGIALIALGAITAAGLGSMLAASWSGTFELGSLAVGARPAAAAVAAAATVATALVAGGTLVIRRERRRRHEVAHLDARAEQAEEEAHARLLAMRVDVLTREIEALERRRDELPVPATVGGRAAEDDDVVVVVPESD
jgi:hypothetical protein